MKIKKRFFILFIIVALLGTALYIYIAMGKVQKFLADQPTSETESRDQSGLPSRKYTDISINKNTFHVEVADSIPAITRGLGERDALGSDGMLFMMPSRGIPSFWMKGMRFDLDFVWIDGNTVVDLTENVSAKIGASDGELKVYRPKTSITHVLEMNAGEVKRRNIQIKDTVTY